MNAFIPRDERRAARPIPRNEPLLLTRNGDHEHPLARLLAIDGVRDLVVGRELRRARDTGLDALPYR
jgi:hypothetical protein